MNFINQGDTFRTEREKKGDEKVRTCSQLRKPRLYGFPLSLTQACILSRACWKGSTDALLHFPQHTAYKKAGLSEP